MMIRRRGAMVYFLIALTVLLLINGCTAIRRSILPYKDKPLVWQPTGSIQGLDLSKVDTTLYKEKFRVVPFADQRENKNEIALKVTTKDDVSAWSTDRFKYILKQVGLNIVDSGETVVIKGDILTFVVVEDSLYRGNIGIEWH